MTQQDKLVSQVTFALPDWLPAWLAAHPFPVAGDDQARMAWVVALSADNSRRDGGPFAAAVVGEDGQLLAVGMNRVMAMGQSLAHAEVLALMMAQARQRHWDLGASGHCTLYTSCEPCAQCLGALVWAGVKRVVTAAGRDDAQAVGFDEGPAPPDWVGELTARGIGVARGVCRQDAVRVLRAYAADGVIYNAARDQQ